MKGFTAVAAENSSFQQIIDIGDMLAVFIGKDTFLYGIEYIFWNDGGKDIVICYAAVCVQTDVLFVFEHIVQYGSREFFAFIEDATFVQFVGKVDEPCAVCIARENFSDDGSLFLINNGFLVFDAVAEINAPAGEVSFDSCFA